MMMIEVVCPRSEDDGSSDSLEQPLALPAETASTQWQSIRLKARQPLAPQRKSIQLNSSVSALAVGGDDVLEEKQT